MVLTTEDNWEATEVGGKAIRLRELQNDGFWVPLFVVVPVSQVRRVQAELAAGETAGLWQLCAAVQEKCAAARYAVRSAALIEDEQYQAQAGQFKTVLAVAPDELAAAIRAVITDAAAKLAIEHQLSIIVQKYVAADTSGVLFSRSPLNAWELVLEYRAGAGGAVGGETVERLSLLATTARRHAAQFPQIERLVAIARQIEKRYGWPQDIEWAIQRDKVFILQTRPITTISAAEWQGTAFLAEHLRDTTGYFYEQTDLSETFRCPRPLAYSIAEALYGESGPIQQAYHQLGVVYQDTHQLQLVGNTVYVDRQAEIKSVFPALGFVAAQSKTPRLESALQLGRTIKNWLRLTFISIAPDQELARTVERLLQAPLSETDTVAAQWQQLLAQYPVVFTVNIRAQKALAHLERLLGPQASELPALLSAAVTGPSYPVFATLVGNSISVDDVSVFSPGVGQAPVAAAEYAATGWFQALLRWKQRGLTQAITQAQFYYHLREQARWLSVRLMNQLRAAALQLGSEQLAGDSELIYYATITELLAGDVSVARCQQRQQEYLQRQTMVLPRTVSDFVVSATAARVGLAPGIATGRLVSADHLHSEPGPKILYTDVLSPDLTQYFPLLQGIVTKQGGVLSHLSIMAREAGIPVVQTAESLEFGQLVVINGGTGEVVGKAAAEE